MSTFTCTHEASSFQVSFDQRPEQKINSTSKQIQEAVADINKVFDEVVSDSGDSLSGNRIHYFPRDAVRVCTKLSHLNIGYNDITSVLPQDFIGWAENLDTLILR